MKKAGVKNQAKYYTPVFNKEGFHHWMKKEKRTLTEDKQFEALDIIHEMLQECS